VKYKLWWALAVLLILTDMGITYWAVTGNHAEEKNPAVLEVADMVGLELALLFGGTARLLSLVLAMWVQTWLPKWKWTMPLIGVTVQAPPVIWNLFVLL